MLGVVGAYVWNVFYVLGGSLFGDSAGEKFRFVLLWEIFEAEKSTCNFFLKQLGFLFVFGRFLKPKKVLATGVLPLRNIQNSLKKIEKNI
ncbi:MAG: hypothetical protein QXR19_17800 [Candidatus Jordarchaeaceae archaeon]